MDELGKAIRNALRAKNMSSADLANLINMHPRTIDNVIHGKSRKESLLQRILIALELDFSHPTFDVNPPLDIELYNIASSTIINLIKEIKIECSKLQLSHLIDILYKYLQSISNKDNIEIRAEAYAKGMIDFGNANFFFNNKKES